MLRDPFNYFNYEDLELTPKQWAAKVVYIELDSALELWRDRYEEELSSMNVKDRQSVEVEMNKLQSKLEKMLLKALKK